MHIPVTFFSLNRELDIRVLCRVVCRCTVDVVRKTRKKAKKQKEQQQKRLILRLLSVVTVQSRTVVLVLFRLIARVRASRRT